MSIKAQDKAGRPVELARRGTELYLDQEPSISRSFAGGQVTLESATRAVTIDRATYARLDAEPSTAPAAPATESRQSASPDAVPDAAYRAGWSPYRDGLQRQVKPDDLYKTR